MEQNQTDVLQEQKPKKARAPYVGFNWKQRLFPVILLSLAAGFTVCFFGPFDIYSNNVDEFRFALSSFLLYNVLWSVGISAAICALLLPLRGRVFDVAYAIFFWITLMLFVQGNYLNIGISSLAGDGMGEDGMGVASVIVNTVIWVLVGGGCVSAVCLVRGKHREIIPTVGIIAMITVIGMQTIPFAVNSLATDVWERNHSTLLTDEEANEHFLTYKNMNKVSAGKNVIYFVIDRFDVTYYEDYALKECPEIFYNLDGFTYFDDMTSLYPRTFPSVAYMLTGKEHDFHDGRVEYFEGAYQESEFLKTLKENNYNINIYTDSYYAYNDAKDMQEYVTNSSASKHFKVVNTDKLAGDMMQISLFRYLPHLTKSWAGDVSTSDFDKYIVYDTEYPKYTTDTRDLYRFLMDNTLETFDGANNFTFIHFTGCHLPIKYDENYEEWKGGGYRNDPIAAMKQSFGIINRYIDQLKALGLYEDATIIITGDHGWHGGSDTDVPLRRPHVTALFVKERGKSGDALKTNRAPVAQADIIPTILFSEGIVTDGTFGKTVFDYTEGEARTRKYNFQSLQYNAAGDIDYEVVIYEIVGRARDFENWKLVSRDDYVGNIYQ